MVTRINVDQDDSLPQPMTISGLLAAAQSRLSPVSDSPHLDSQLLLGQAMHQGRDWLIAHGTDQLEAATIECFELLMERRIAGEPIAYILGTQGFWRHEFHVSPAVLIPRPETELLIEILLARLGPEPRQIVDLGTGSGALAVSLASERPQWFVTGIDCSEAAIELATMNAGELDNLELRTGDWCQGLAPGSLDAIVSNPPYIREHDPHLMQLSFEPVEALASGPDGLDAIRQIIPHAHQCLKNNGLLLIEHGYDQQRPVEDLFRQAGFEQVTGFNDLNKVPRAVLGYRS